MMALTTIEGKALLDETRAVLTTTLARWEQMTHTLSPELLTEAPAAGEWSAIECLLHLIDVEQVFQFRLNAFLSGMVAIPAFNPDSEGTRPGKSIFPAQLAADFTALRTESIRSIEPLTLSDLQRTSRHAELGPITLENMLNEWAAHDLNHTIQAERAVMQPFIRGCGPWNIYFTDNKIER
jgi:hypothetical protein